MTDVEQLTGPICRHGEGPVWSSTWGGLRWVDLTAGDVLALDGSGGVRRWHVDTVAAAIRPRAGGGIALALERGFALADEFGGPLHDLGALWPDPDLRLNDGGCDPQGGFLCGSMATDYAAGRGTLHRLAPDGTVTPVLPGLGVPNGLDWTPDGTTAYFADSLAGTIDVFAHDPERGLHDRRPFAHVPSEEGLPDGLTVDADGYVWVAIWGGGQVRRYAPDGRLDEVLEFPVRRVTACTFGGADLDELYVTTVGDHALEHEGDVAGALFRVRVGVTGQPVRPFAG